MQVELQNIGKRFLFEWVFKSIQYSFESNKSYAIIGANGSGKSTLLKIISGKEQASQGKVVYGSGDLTIDPSHVFKNIGFVAPYQDLIEELTLQETIDYHCRLTGSDKTLITQKLDHHSNLKNAWNKQLLYFSSGMKQRVKLVLALFSNNTLILLDEPTSNLDNEGISWYQEEMIQLKSTKTIIVCSNQVFEYEFCDAVLDVSDFKKKS